MAHPRRRSYGRRRWPGPGGRWTALLLVTMAAACAPTSPARRAAPPPNGVAPTTTPTAPAPTTTTDPGALPQTDVEPPPDDGHFRAAMAALWSGVVDDSVPAAMAAFFPEHAYLQVKTVADPAADFQERLVGEFGLDLDAAHRLLGADAPDASLEAVEVPAANAHWVPPGVCANRVGYFEVAHARVVYDERGVVRSFGIASLISWRGEWYVVHLGAVVRSGRGGEVDDPATGPGSSPPSSTC